MDGLIGSRDRCLLLHLSTAANHGPECLRTARQPTGLSHPIQSRLQANVSFFPVSISHKIPAQNKSYLHAHELGNHYSTSAAARSWNYSITPLCSPHSPTHASITVACCQIHAMPDREVATEPVGTLVIKNAYGQSTSQRSFVLNLNSRDRPHFHCQHHSHSTTSSCQ